MASYFSSTIKISQAAVGKLLKNSTQALEMAGDALLTEIKNAKAIPFDNGTMQNENTYLDISQNADVSMKIVTSSPQARRHYFHPEYNFQHGRRGKWLEPWIDGNRKEFFANAYKKLFKKLGGV